MNIALATHGFVHPGGSETYVLTVAEQLQRLGHGVVILVGETGPMADFASERGHRVETKISVLDGWCDSIIVQDGILSYQLAERYPELPQLFRAASDLHDLQLPPGLPGVVEGVVVCSERVGDRIRAMAGSRRVHRLRQPIDTERFMPSGTPAARPRTALLLGNALRGERLAILRIALDELGIEFVQTGLTSRLTCCPEQLIWGADFVIAKARAALEAMACGKPVFVYDQFGGDGWVTADRYPAMESDNFAGLSGPPVASLSQLRDELRDYRAEMGVVNRELATEYHGARAHTKDLCGLLASATPPQTREEGAPLRELSRLVRVQWLTEVRALSFQDAHARAREQLHQERAQYQTRISDLEAELATRRVQLGVRAGHALDIARKGLGRR